MYKRGWISPGFRDIDGVIELAQGHYGHFKVLVL